MASTIKLKRGLKASLPTLDVGEPAFCTDTKELFIGNGTTNTLIGGSIIKTKQGSDFTTADLAAGEIGFVYN